MEFEKLLLQSSWVKTFSKFCVEADEVLEGYKKLPKLKMGMKADMTKKESIEIVSIL